MTWEIFVQDMPSGLTHAREIPRTFRPTALGERDELIEKITAFEPAVDFSDPSWGHLQQSSFLVEFNLGRQPVVDAFALHIRGASEARLFVSALLDCLGFRTFDPRADCGLFRSGGNAVTSLRRWRQYRAQLQHPRT